MPIIKNIEISNDKIVTENNGEPIDHYFIIAISQLDNN
jgi:hypothetical protein